MRQYFLILMVSVAILSMVSCKKDNLKKSLTISDFEVKPESNTAPTKVLVIYNWKVENYGSYNIYHQGAYKTFSVDKPSNASEGYNCSGNWSKTDTLNLYYLYPGNYEIQIDVINGETLTRNFTLQ